MIRKREKKPEHSEVFGFSRTEFGKPIAMSSRYMDDLDEINEDKGEELETSFLGLVKDKGLDEVCLEIDDEEVTDL